MTRAGEDDPVAVARRANEWFVSIPFEDLRAAVVEEPTFEGGMARLESLGYDSVEDLVDPEIKLDITRFPGGETLPSGRGRDVWAAFWREWLEPWEGLEVEHGNYQAHGDQVLVDVRVKARGVMSGAEVGLEMTQLWTVRDGRLVGYTLLQRREDALELLGEGSERR